ncbi:Regulator of G- signaling 7 [Brachionus plicatilis]|uniref:Regulator of G-signaling 7 n=1 Tax=Brachionus plicatilis TaxID=10195 RepID=A0A3M7QS06_BRAPC|nr:Regulator of G- signaling 7 [Brachionus plicatilis]
MEISHNHLLSKPSYPRYYAFQRMEKVIKAMQHRQTGIPIKSQKLFLTTISNAFTGEDLIDWLEKNLEIEEIDEALHLATLLCKFGYYFQVTENGSTNVKEDSELYRFQSPYFWISTNWNAGHIDYAIYLLKRTMRNQEKHGLNDLELTILEDLRKKLAHQWDFVKMQADAQIKVLKDRKKAEKTFLDSQERAFWKIMRSANNSSSVLEEDARVNLMQVNPKFTKKDEFIRKKISFFEQSLKNRVRTKASQALQNLCAYSEIYFEYDGIFGHCQPSNPWITDDTTMWEVSSPLVEQPTQLRVKKWLFSFRELLSDPTGVREFMKFCEVEFSVENLKFYLACQAVKRAPLSELPILVHKIYKEHLSPEAGAEVNVNDIIRNKITKELDNPSRTIFYEAEKHIFELMKKNSYSRFEQSEIYKNLLEKAIIPAPKKSKIFHFVTLDYFRNRDESTDESDDDEQRGDFVAGGIYAPTAQSISAAAAGLTLSIAAAAGIKRHFSSSIDGKSDTAGLAIQNEN